MANYLLGITAQRPILSDGALRYIHLSFLNKAGSTLGAGDGNLPLAPWHPQLLFAGVALKKAVILHAGKVLLAHIKPGFCIVAPIQIGTVFGRTALPIA